MSVQGRPIARPCVSALHAHRLFTSLAARSMHQRAKPWSTARMCSMSRLGSSGLDRGDGLLHRRGAHAHRLRRGRATRAQALVVRPPPTAWRLRLAGREGRSRPAVEDKSRRAPASPGPGSGRRSYLRGVQPRSAQLGPRRQRPPSASLPRPQVPAARAGPISDRRPAAPGARGARPWAAARPQPNSSECEPRRTSWSVRVSGLR
jgi:hypothetical protein